MKNISTLLASDLLIKITPRAEAHYRGTAEQLSAEGLIPGGFKWPVGTARVSYVIGEFDYWMGRCRPTGTKGPMKIWVNGDYWFLRRSLKSDDENQWLNADIYEQTMALANTIRRGTSEWARTCNLACKARMDNKYMAFRLQVLGEQKRGRGRPVKSVTAEKSNGASA